MFNVMSLKCISNILKSWCMVTLLTLAFFLKSIGSINHVILLYLLVTCLIYLNYVVWLKYCEFDVGMITKCWIILGIMRKHDVCMTRIEETYFIAPRFIETPFFLRIIKLDHVFRLMCCKLFLYYGKT